MNLKFHHIGIACEDIKNTLEFIDNTFNIINKTQYGIENIDPIEYVYLLIYLMYDLFF